MAAAAVVADGSAARGFWLRSQKEAMLTAYTPFVVRLAAGRLELETLRQCVAQDVHFFRALVSAYELAEDCADDDDARAEICELRKAVLKELKSHSSVLEEWGIDSTKEIGPTPTTKRYTDFLLATAAGKVEGVKGAGKIVTPFEKTKIAAYTLGAIAPITRLYAFLGKELKKFINFDENGFLYKKWINNYSSENYEAAAVQIEELLDKLSVSLTGEELEVIEKLYHRAIKLEIEFFSALPVQPAVVPLIRLHDPADRLVIFCDFDLTCTLVDSSAILAEIAILKASKGDDNSDSLIPRRSSIDMRNSWNALSRQYTEEYEQCIESLLPKEEAKTFNYEALYNGLKQLTSFEKQANSRVVESGMLSGMNIEEIKRAGERLILLDGCTDFFQKVVKRKKELNVDLHVLSYCWCADLIRSAFSSVGCLDELSIRSNEFKYENSISTGEISGNIESPMDKLEAFKDILSNSGKHLSVYIGDSVGDLLCLIEADVGIVVGSSASLRTVGKRFGVSFVPLFPGLVNKQRQLAGAADSSSWKGMSGVLYTVSSWSEIQAFLLGA